jgi:hypothetical protein
MTRVDPAGSRAGREAPGEGARHAEHIRSAEDNARLAPARLALRRLLEVTETTRRGRSWDRLGHSHRRVGSIWPTADREALSRNSRA